jgi:hypothetical protein
MRSTNIKIGLVSTAMLFASVPGSLALPGRLQPQQLDAPGAFVPRQYDVYGAPNAPQYGHYSYGGYGPQPTVSSIDVTSVSSDLGESTSSSGPSGKLSSKVNT